MEGVMATPPDQRRAPSRPPQAPGPGQRRTPPRAPAPPPRPPLPSRKPAEPLLQQRSFAALILALISLVGLLMANGNTRRGIVVLAVTLIIGGGGLWLSTTAMSRAKKAGT